eukprot:TRINITY_DN39335_c0_g1_i1.p1 TRINITY_DN39335_c0_g1~~TRINITY_DN39335_c0_g1_i1.p1  ORF type:complete len:201 (+),score=49.90 TRINITY_DN39335_c0_g1_i1:119-721(+)
MLEQIEAASHEALQREADDARVQHEVERLEGELQEQVEAIATAVPGMDSNGIVAHFPTSTVSDPSLEHQLSQEIQPGSILQMHSEVAALKAIVLGLQYDEQHRALDQPTSPSPRSYYPTLNDTLEAMERASQDVVQAHHLSSPSPLESGLRESLEEEEEDPEELVHALAQIKAMHDEVHQIRQAMALGTMSTAQRAQRHL